jgi:hypothetical protein
MMDFADWWEQNKESICSDICRTLNLSLDDPVQELRLMHLVFQGWQAGQIESAIWLLNGDERSSHGKPMKIQETDEGHGKSFILLCDCRVAMVTFGNRVLCTMKKGEKMLYNRVCEVNESFVFVQSGLNYYILESKAVPKEP